MENNSNIGNSNTKILLIIIGIMLLGIIIYLGYEKMTCESKNKHTENSKECEVCKTVTNEFEMQTVERIGEWFYWLGEDKIDNMNNISNNLKFYIASNDIKRDVYEDDNDFPTGYSANNVDEAIKKIFGDKVTMQRKDINSTNYGACPEEYDYDSAKGTYNHTMWDCVGPHPYISKKITKIASYDKYYEIFIKAIYDDLYESTPTEIDALIEQGKTFKLTFDKSDNGPIWTKYEVIK